MKPVLQHQGNSPLILSQPHTGEAVPDYIAQSFNETGLGIKDTDWHIDSLYDFAEALGATLIQAQYSRYVIDVNRPVENTSLYPGQNTTSLCPTTTFDGEPIYKKECEPDEQEIRKRINDYYLPYHKALSETINRVKNTHGYVLLYDCHSIRSCIPRLFRGSLPNFNIGTYNGLSCPTGITQKIQTICEEAEGYDSVVNGRFKGGHITRNYGKPKESVFSLQMELTQRSYMQESPPWELHIQKADKLKQVLKKILQTFLETGKRIAENKDQEI